MRNAMGSGERIDRNQELAQLTPAGATKSRRSSLHISNYTSHFSSSFAVKWKQTITMALFIAEKTRFYQIRFYSLSALSPASFKVSLIYKKTRPPRESRVYSSAERVSNRAPRKSGAQGTTYIMPPMPPMSGIAGAFFSGISAIMHSVVSSNPAIDAAFCSA